MKPTIHDYIQAAFMTRKKVEGIKQGIVTKIHNQVTNRIAFSFPLIQIDTYNVQSYIVQLDANDKTSYYNILDHSMLDFCEWFLFALEYGQPNLVVAAYKELKRYICIANSDLKGAEYYQLTKVFYTNYELEKANDSMDDGISLVEKYEMMLRFHFLHEYGHYLVKEPVRDYGSAIGILDIIAESLLKDMETKRFNDPCFSDEYNEILDNLKTTQLEYYKNEYKNNPNFKEEVLCDFQAVLCLLELSNNVSPQIIIESAIMYLYVQYAIWLAKKSESALHTGEIIHFRINMLFELADFLHDEEIALALANRINNSNRFVSVKTTYCGSIDYSKYHYFFTTLATTIFADKENKNKSINLDDNIPISPLDFIILDTREV